MLCFDREGRETRIVHTTLHVSLRRALDLVTQPRVEHVIRAADAALRRIGIASPRISVAGVNPHASESGLFGDEEEHIIAPAAAPLPPSSAPIRRLRSKVGSSISLGIWPKARKRWPCSQARCIG